MSPLHQPCHQCVFSIAANVCGTVTLLMVLDYGIAVEMGHSFYESALVGISAVDLPQL